jgi:hypothetical protein
MTQFVSMSAAKIIGLYTHGGRLFAATETGIYVMHNDIWVPMLMLDSAPPTTISLGHAGMTR